MTWMQIIVLSIVQGITEFLPISSSGHLILVPAFLGWTDQGIFFDVALHAGSLLAVCVYFRHDLIKILYGSADLFMQIPNSSESKLAAGIALATVPAVIAGLFFSEWIGQNLRGPIVVSFTLAFYAVLMWFADLFASRKRKITEIKLGDAFLIGLAQALALIPGTSRSGITITAGLMLGMRRRDATKFSFILSIPVILLAAGYEFLTMLFSEEIIFWQQLFGAMFLSSVVAYLSISFFMRIVSKIGLIPFVIYRLFLAGIIVYVFI
jgi:undecaprenyl-diphosphatase